jgi:MFS transporter, UMF1 family
MRWLKSRPQWCWALNDWANSAFATTVIAGFFPAFFSQFWSQGAESALTTFRLGLANSASGAVIALLAPLLGVIADRSGQRKKHLALWSLLGILATLALYFVAQGQWIWAAGLFVLASIGYNASSVFYDSLLLDVAKPAEYERVSSFGFALGYLGGGLLFAVNILMVVKPAWFGFASAASAVQASFVMVAVWWFIFMLPLLAYVKEAPVARGPGAAGFLSSIRALSATLKRIRHRRELWLFLLAYWLYIDGVYTVIKMAVNFGLSLGLDSQALLGALLLTQFVAFPAAIAFGRLGERIGPRRGILLGLMVYFGLTCGGYFLESTTGFYAMACVVGLVQGGVQSLSRAYFSRLVPQGQSAEFFGFYNLIGRFGTVLGPLLMGLTALATGSTRVSILSLLLLFGVGGFLLWRLPTTAREAVEPRA